MKSREDGEGEDVNCQRCGRAFAFNQGDKLGVCYCQCQGPCNYGQGMGERNSEYATRISLERIEKELWQQGAMLREILELLKKPKESP